MKFVAAVQGIFLSRIYICANLLIFMTLCKIIKVVPLWTVFLKARWSAHLLFFSLSWLLVLHWYASNVLVQYMNVMGLKITVSKLIVIILMILIRVMSAIITEVALYLVRVSTDFLFQKSPQFDLKYRSFTILSLLRIHIAIGYE